ncbi:MAG: relaxase [Ferruginibacter sp.]
MVTRGKFRGNGAQLASYLLKDSNDNVMILDISGTSHTNNLKKSLIEMSLTSELTKSDKGLYHVQLSPEIGFDKSMTKDDWLKAVSIFENETGFTGQKRVLVMHEKNNRKHLHCVWERFDHEKGKMIPGNFSRLAQDRARIKIENELHHSRTPIRNLNREKMKEYLSDLWSKTKNADDFIKEAEKNGYVITAGTERPYVVIDKTGRSFNLVRQLEGIRTKDVRERFKSTKLPKEKQIIYEVREKLNAGKGIDNKRHYNENSTEILTDQSKPNKAANDNTKQVKHYPVITPSYTIDKVNVSFDVSKLDNEKTIADKKEKLMFELQERKLKLAKEFRENEREL